MKIHKSLPLLFPIGSALIIFSSAIKNILSFSVFNIAIIRYVTLSDFFLLIIIDAVFLVTALVFLGVAYVAFEVKKAPNNDDEVKKARINDDEVEKAPIIPIIIYLSIVSGGMLLLIFFGESFSYIIITMVLMGLFLISIIFFLYMINKIVREMKVSFILLFLLLSIILIMSSLGFRDAHGKMNVNDTRKYTFILEDETVSTDKNLIYVGKTLEYIFIYNKEKDMARIIKTDILKEMRVEGIKDIKPSKGN